MVAMRRILVVDDEPIVTRSCQRILSGRGDDVVTTQSGQEGLRRALSEHFDLVMADLRMPDLDGMELVRTLRRQRPSTPVIVITGYGSIPSAVEAARLGVSDYIEKPFGPDQIAEAVEKALSPGEPPEGETRIDAEQIRCILLQASSDPAFGERLLREGSRVLLGLDLPVEARAAIVSGDVVWLEKTCGDLGEAERGWLLRRLEAENW